MGVASVTVVSPAGTSACCITIRQILLVYHLGENIPCDGRGRKLDVHSPIPWRQYIARYGKETVLS